MGASFWFPLAVAIIGGLLWVITQGKPSEAGKIGFAVGLFVLTWALANGALTIHVVGGK